MNSQNSIVSARIPKEIRNQGDAALKRIDSTVTELVNSAFEYVIKTGSLPTISENIASGKKIKRKLSSHQKSQFHDFLKATSLPLPDIYSELDANQIKEMRLAEKYEH